MSSVQPLDEHSLAQVALWRAKRGFLPWPEEWLSPRGWWVPGLVAGWLVTTDSGRALLEDFESNPDADRASVDSALFDLERHISAEAKTLGIRYLIGTTMLQCIRDRVSRAGYGVTEAKFSIHTKVIR